MRNYTIVIPTKNEELNIVDCLNSLPECNVYVIDSMSTDKTCEIARKHGAVVVDFEWNGSYPKKRNYFLLNFEVNTDYVLFLDADERLNAKVIKELDQATSLSLHYDAFSLQYTNYFNQTILKYGIPQKKISLFKKDILYERVDTNAFKDMDMEIHEHPVGYMNLGVIKSEITHLDQNLVEKFIVKHVSYAKWEVERVKAISEKVKKKFTIRQHIKYALIRSIWFPFLYFVMQYFVRFGFLDGKAGFQYAVFKFIYFFQIYVMLDQERKGSNDNR